MVYVFIVALVEVILLRGFAGAFNVALTVRWRQIRLSAPASRSDIIQCVSASVPPESMMIILVCTQFVISALATYAFVVRSLLPVRCTLSVSACVDSLLMCARNY